MTIDQLRSKIISIMFSEKAFGVSSFACIKRNNELILKKIQVTDALNDSIEKLLLDSARAQYLSDEAELDSADNISDNRKILFEIEQTEQYEPFAFVKRYKSITETYSERDQAFLAGFVFAVNRNNSVIWFYQNVYPVRLINRKHGLYAIINHGQTYTVLDKDVLKIESRIDIAIVGNSIITSKIDLLQRSFGFDEYVKKEAHKTIDQIAEMSLVRDTAKFEELISKEKLTNAKKLMKVRHSPVLKMDKSELLHRLINHPRYKNKFKYENDMIVIASQKDASEFIKMLNDDIVRSELTGQEYDSPSKHMLEPLSA